MAAANTLAQKKKEAENMTSRDRLWASLEQPYESRIEESNKAFDQNYSQTQNAMLKRGIGRTSYAAQIGANTLQQKAQAADKI